MTRSYEKTDENRRVFNMFEDDPSPVVATRLRPLADDLRIWRMPAKFQWTMLRAASLLEQASSEALARKFDCEFYEPRSGPSVSLRHRR